MTLRITIACPEGLIAQANQFALCVGNAPADAQTFGPAVWKSASGERYALASLLAGSQFPSVAGSPLEAPEYAPDATIAEASSAHAALQIWSPRSQDSCPEVGPDRRIAIVGLEAGLAIPLLGLSPVPVED